MFAFLKPSLSLDDFHAVLDTKAGRWYNACLRITGEARSAEDAVQDALLKAWGQRESFRGGAELDTWIHRIAINAAIDIARRMRPDADDEYDLDLHPSNASSPEVAYESHSIGVDVNTALDRLTSTERECFVLKHYEGWSLEDIAKQQNTNINNAKQTLFRAVKKLRVALNDWCDK